MPIAVGYIRVSTNEQAKAGYSLAAQDRKVVGHIESEDWTLGKLYIEKMTGTRDDRPELAELLTTLDEIDYVVIISIDRLGRDDTFLFDLYGKFKRAGVTLIATNENIDDSENGLLLRGIQSTLAAHESRRIGKRVRAAITERAEKGKHHAAWPFGLENGGKRTEPGASVVQRVWRESCEGAPQRSIATKLNAEKVPTASGRGEWRQSAVSRILDNITYTGQIETNGVVYPGTHDALVTMEQWKKVHELRAANKRDSGGQARGRKPKRHLFGNGLLKCGHCGGSMLPHTPRTGGGAERYECATHRNSGPNACPMTSVPRAQLDTAVFDYFQRVGVDLDATKAELVRQLDAQRDSADQLLAAARHDEQRAQGNYDRMRGEVKEGAISLREWREQWQSELESDLEAARAKREQLEGQHKQASADALTAAELDSKALHLLASVREQIAGDVTAADGIQGVRAALSRLFDRFEVARPLAGELSATEREIAAAQAAEFDAADEPLAVDRWLVTPIPREELAWDLDGYWRSLLKREPLQISAANNEPAMNPGGYCGLGGTGVACPIGLHIEAASG